MQSPAHFVVGAAICRYVKKQPLGLLLAFASHFALDALPHFEDPSILPHGISHFAARLWVWVPLVLAVAVVPLALLIWGRFRNEPHGMVFAAYLIVGGVVACSPDYITETFGRNTLIAHWNSGAHQTWTPLYYRLLVEHRSWRPTIAAVCLLTETAVLTAGLWLLFRRLSSQGAPPSLEHLQ